MPDSSNASSKLAGAIDVDISPGSRWSQEELGEMLAHQLRTPFRDDLAALSADWAKQLDRLAVPEERNLSIGHILRSPQPRMELLQLIKDFAKRAIDREVSALPEELGGLLYYASISTAWIRLQTKLHSLNDAALKQGLTWATSQSWITPELRELFESHRNQLAG
jgi:hypothetical protein